MCVVVIILFNVKDFRFPYREPDSRKFLEKHIYLICSSYFQIFCCSYDQINIIFCHIFHFGWNLPN